MFAPRTNRRNGFTIVEVLLASTICIAVAAALFTWLLAMLDIANLSTGVALVSKDMRRLTTDMTDEGRNAGSFEIYNSFSDRTRCLGGQAGDYIVLRIRNITGDEIRTVGYYRDAGADGEGPVRKHDSRMSGAPAAGTLPDAATVGDWPEVVELARGLASANSRLFYNSPNQTFYMLYGQIVQQGRRRQGTDDGRATSTYNFTIVPRS